MLVVVSDIVSESVEWTVVGPRLLVPLLEEVVFGDEVPCAGVQTSREEGGEDKIPDGIRRVCELEEARANVVDESVEAELDGRVQRVPDGQLLAANEARSKCVKKDLEGAEECFSRHVAQDEQLGSGGKIGIDAVHSECTVVSAVKRCSVLLSTCIPGGVHALQRSSRTETHSM